MKINIHSLEGDLVEKVNADDKIFKSEINPKKKNNKHKIFILIFISKAIKDKNKTTPPVNGIFKFDVNFWCLSHVKLNKKFFLPTKFL